MSETSDTPLPVESTAIPFIPPDPIDIPQPRTGHLKDCITPITIYPIPGNTKLPEKLVLHLWNEFNDEINDGNTYPMEQPLTLAQFKNYWLSIFCAIMLKGSEPDISEDRDWATECLGTFYIKPNYPGRCNHICNGGFMTCKAFRNRGVGKLLGEAYIDYATKLGYKSSLFNLVFETNTASWMIWDKLGFQRLAVLPAAGRLNCSDELVNAIIFRKDLSPDAEYVSTQRFKKIKYYLTTGKYPPNADRAEKSRLRSAATHYSIETDGAKTRLFLRDKEVIDEEFEQYDVARRIHTINHGGINKTTALVSEKYHWTQIKSTVMKVVKNCPECIENTKMGTGARNSTSDSTPHTSKSSSPVLDPSPLPLAKSSTHPTIQSSPPLSSTLAPATVASAATIHRADPLLAPSPISLPPTSVGPEIFRPYPQPQMMPRLQQHHQLQPSRLQHHTQNPYSLEMPPASISASSMDIPIDPQIQTPQLQSQQQHTHAHPTHTQQYTTHPAQSPHMQPQQLYQSQQSHPHHQQPQFQGLTTLTPTTGSAPFNASIVATAQSALRHHSARADQHHHQSIQPNPSTSTEEAEDDQILQVHLRQYTVDRDLGESEVTISQEVSMDGLGEDPSIGGGGTGVGSSVEGTQFEEATASMGGRGALLSSDNGLTVGSGMFGDGGGDGLGSHVDHGEEMDLDHRHREDNDEIGMVGGFDLRGRA